MTGNGRASVYVYQVTVRRGDGSERNVLTLNTTFRLSGLSKYVFALKCVYDLGTVRFDLEFIILIRLICPCKIGQISKLSYFKNIYFVLK